MVDRRGRSRIWPRARLCTNFAATTGSGGTRNALGSTHGALQHPHATSRHSNHLADLCFAPKKVVPHHAVPRSPDTDTLVH
jgi:hypothetical protein